MNFNKMEAKFANNFCSLFSKMHNDKREIYTKVQYVKNFVHYIKRRQRIRIMFEQQYMIKAE